jgi:putative membrane protein
MRTAALLITMAVLAGCGGKSAAELAADSTRIADSTARANAPPPAPVPPALTDGQIVGIVQLANQAEINDGKQASSRATSGMVKSFARMMVTDHEQMHKETGKLADSLKMSEDDSPAKQRMSKAADAEFDSLKSLKGAAYDKAYIDAAVSDHQQVLSVLDKDLIPGAVNPSLKTALQAARGKVAAHLAKAQDIQKTMTPK